jgi:predicted dithiol-disulfide oxidoreductase (DUF899 family)
MSLPQIVSQEEWLAARTELLAQEKELTKRRDALATKRRELPMVEVTKPYEFEGALGTAGLLDLFEGRSQLIVVHFMFDPEWEKGCPSCTAGADEVAPGLIEHLHARGTTLAYVSRAPFAKLESYRAERGWTFPWYSSFGSDFNYDFNVTVDSSVAPPMLNFRTAEEWDDVGQPVAEGEYPGRSHFLRVGDRIFHTNSVYARGLEGAGGSYYLLDETALGRQEEWEEPKGRVEAAHANIPDFRT